jgi:hypothetical protein
VIQDDRAPPLLAIARIVCVLGMSIGVSLGIFLALGGWFLPAVISLAAAVPFFGIMRYMEKRFAQGP